MAFFAVTWGAKHRLLMEAPARFVSLAASSLASASEECLTTGACGTQNGCSCTKMRIACQAREGGYPG